MKKLSKDEKTQRDEIIAKFAEKWGDIETAQQEAQAGIDKLNEAINAYNEVVDEANQFASDIASAMDDYMGERSEKWQEGDAGQAYGDWKGEWEGYAADEIAVCDDLDIGEQPDDADLLEQLPEEPS